MILILPNTETPLGFCRNFKAKPNMHLVTNDFEERTIMSRTSACESIQPICTHKHSIWIILELFPSFDWQIEKNIDLIIKNKENHLNCPLIKVKNYWMTLIQFWSHHPWSWISIPIIPFDWNLELISIGCHSKVFPSKHKDLKRSILLF